jgi:hypothetical protein
MCGACELRHEAAAALRAMADNLVLMQWLEMHGCWVEVEEAFKSLNPDERFAYFVRLP